MELRELQQMVAGGLAGVEVAAKGVLDQSILEQSRLATQPLIERSALFDQLYARSEASSTLERAVSQLSEGPAWRDLAHAARLATAGLETPPYALPLGFEPFLARDLSHRALMDQAIVSDQRSAWHEQIEALTRSGGDAFAGFNMPPLGDFLPERSVLARMLEGLTMPVLSEEVLRLSVCNVAGLSAISAALHDDPSAQSTRDALSAILGPPTFDSWTDERLFAWQNRYSEYRSIEFRDQLTVLHEPAFTEALEVTELLFRDNRPASTETDRSRPNFIRARQHRAFGLISDLEIELRTFIDQVMTHEWGDGWVKHKVNGDVREKWKERREAAVSDGETAMPLIWYADLDDYAGLITRNDNWKLFHPVFGCKDDVQVSFRRIRPLRRCTMHARPLLKDDLLTLVVEVNRILRTIRRSRN